MDTISRESNSSMLPVAGVILGGLALLIGGYSAIMVNKANKALAEQQGKLQKIDSVEVSVSSAVAAAEKASRDLQSLTRSTQDAFNTVSTEIGKLGSSITKLEESAKKPVVAAAEKKGGGSSGPAVAGPGEYVVKSGDTGMRIAASQGVSVGDLQAVNPGVNWSALKVGQKLKLPAKK